MFEIDGGDGDTDFSDPEILSVLIRTQEVDVACLKDVEDLTNMVND